MPKRRKRINKAGGPAACTVTIPAELSPYLYRDKIDRRYRDETELVATIIRAWYREFDSPDWAKLAEDIRRNDEETATRRAPRNKGNAPSDDAPAV